VLLGRDDLDVMGINRKRRILDDGPTNVFRDGHVLGGVGLTFGGLGVVVSIDNVLTRVIRIVIGQDWNCRNEGHSRRQNVVF